MKRRWVLLLALLLVMSLPSTSLATGGGRTWVQDFEKSTAGWNNLLPGTIHRVPSGYVSLAGYASGIASAHGNWHARLRTTGCEPTRTVTTCYGPYTYWGKADGTNPTFPRGGYMTEVDVYLDVAWVATGGGKNDYRFDWSSAINRNSTTTPTRDFVFNVGTPLTTAEALTAPGYYVNASTNATRSGAFPQNPCPNPSTAPNYCRTPVKITQSGWYTFRHSFYPRNHMGTDYLAVDFTVLRHDGVVMGNWFISVTDTQDPLDPDTIANTQGDAYGWFVINEINDNAIDCSNLRSRAIEHPGLAEPCFSLSDQDGRDNGNDGDEDGNDNRQHKYDHHWDDDKK